MEPSPEEREVQHRWLWLLPLVVLLMTLFCVYSSTYLALSQWPTEITHAQMLAENKADYGRNQSYVQFAPVSTQIIIEATRDSLGLSLTPAVAPIDAAHPSTNDIPVQIADIIDTPTRELPTPIITTATHTPTAKPTSEPDTPTPIPTTKPSATPEQEMPTATATATTAPTLPPVNLPTPTAVVPTATFTPMTQPTWPPTAAPPPPPTPTSTPLPTLTAPPPPPAFTPTAQPTATSTATNTPTETPLPTETPTFTPTPTDTPTSDPPPCSGNIPNGEPNIGKPDSNIAEIGCGQSIVVDLGADAIVINGGPETAYDLVYYEFENPPFNINLDWVIVKIGTSSSGPWYQVFNWGDGVPDTNTNIWSAGYGSSGEADNQPIPFAHLYGGNSPGIAIDVDAFSIPPATYQWIQITAPTGGDNDAAEVNAVETLP